MYRKAVLQFTLLTLGTLTLLDNLYYWQGEYFVFGLSANIGPVIATLISGLIMVRLFGRFIKNIRWLTALLFIINQISFSWFERGVIFLHLFKPGVTDEDYTNDPHFIFISAAGLVAAIFLNRAYREPAKMN